jgi:hypothetical protein
MYLRGPVVVLEVREAIYAFSRKQINGPDV